MADMADKDCGGVDLKEDQIVAEGHHPHVLACEYAAKCSGRVSKVSCDSRDGCLP